MYLFSVILCFSGAGIILRCCINPYSFLIFSVCTDIFKSQPPIIQEYKFLQMRIFNMTISVKIFSASLQLQDFLNVFYVSSFLNSLRHYIVYISLF